MGIKTTSFRRIWLYLANHAECRNSIGMPVAIEQNTVVKDITLYPDDTAKMHIINIQGDVVEVTCKLHD